MINRSLNDVEIKIFLIRHAKKDYAHKEGSGGLSTIGRQQAKQFGKNLTGDTVLSFTSGTSSGSRAMETLKHILSASAIQRKFEIQYKDQLTFEYICSDQDHSCFFRKVTKRLKDISTLPHEQLESQIEVVEKKNLRDWLKFKNAKPDQVSIPPYSAGKGITRMIQKIIKEIKQSIIQFRECSRIVVVMVTHEFNVAGFISHLLPSHKEWKKMQLCRVRPLGGIILSLRISKRGGLIKDCATLKDVEFKLPALM